MMNYLLRNLLLVFFSFLVAAVPAYCQFGNCSLTDTFDHDDRVNRNTDPWERDYEVTEFEDGEEDENKGKGDVRVNVYKQIAEARLKAKRIKEIQARIDKLFAAMKKVEKQLDEYRKKMRIYADRADKWAVKGRKDLIKNMKTTLMFTALSTLSSAAKFGKNFKGNDVFKAADKKFKDLFTKAEVGSERINNLLTRRGQKEALVQGKLSSESLIEATMSTTPLTSACWTAFRGLEALTNANRNLGRAEHINTVMNKTREAMLPFRQEMSRLAEKRDNLANSMNANMRKRFNVEAGAL